MNAPGKNGTQAEIVPRQQTHPAQKHSGDYNPPSLKAPGRTVPALRNKYKRTACGLSLPNRADQAESIELIDERLAIIAVKRSTVRLWRG